MPVMKLSLDEETLNALLEDASRHLRPPDRHAQALLRVALWLEFPFPALNPMASPAARPQPAQVTP